MATSEGIHDHAELRPFIPAPGNDSVEDIGQKAQRVYGDPQEEPVRHDEADDRGDQEETHQCEAVRDTEPAQRTPVRLSDHSERDQRPDPEKGTADRGQSGVPDERSETVREK